MKKTLITLFLVLFSTQLYSMVCPDPERPGQSVRVIHDNSIPNIAYAYIDGNGRSTIKWNPSVAAQMKSELREFFRYHECAHIQENYYNFEVNYTHSKFKESRADCLALIKMKADGVLTKDFLLEILFELSYIQPYDTHTHLSGKNRVNVLRKSCIPQNIKF